MAAATVGLLHPGEMGAAVGAVLRGRDNREIMRYLRVPRWKLPEYQSSQT